MKYSTQWLRLSKAEDEYLAAQYEVIQDEERVVKDLLNALSSIDDRRVALRLLSYMPLSISSIIHLLLEIVGIAVDSSNPTEIKLARETLCIYKDDPLIRNAINTYVSSYLSQNDDWNYRRTAELYETLSYKEELTNFVLICLSSNDLDIKEIGDDYRNKIN